MVLAIMKTRVTALKCIWDTYSTLPQQTRYPTRAFACRDINECKCTNTIDYVHHFAWELFKHTHSSQENLSFPTDRQHQSLKTQSAKPGCTGLHTVLYCMQPSLGLINTSTANSTHSVTGLEVHALPCSWHSLIMDLISTTGALVKTSSAE